VAAGLLLALVDLRLVRYAGVLLLGAACGPVWPVIVMTTSVTCGSERRTSAVIGLGAIGFAAGPLLGSLLLKSGLAERFFGLQLALAVVVLVLSSCAGGLCPGIRRR
jgi:MFS family permease